MKYHVDNLWLKLALILDTIKKTQKHKNIKVGVIWLGSRYKKQLIRVSQAGSNAHVVPWSISFAFALNNIGGPQPQHKACQRHRQKQAASLNTWPFYGSHFKTDPCDIVLVFLVWFNFNIRSTKTVTEFVYQVVFLNPFSVYPQMAQVLLNLSL